MTIFQTRHSSPPWRYRLTDRKAVVTPTMYEINDNKGNVVGYTRSLPDARICTAAPALYEALVSFMAIIYESNGVAGYRLNGAVADWSTFGDLIDDALKAIDLVDTDEDGNPVTEPPTQL